MISNYVPKRKTGVPVFLKKKLHVKFVIQLHNTEQTCNSESGGNSEFSSYFFQILAAN